MNGNLLGVSDSIWQLLDQLGTLLGVITGIVWALGIPVAILKRDDLRRWLTRNRFPNVGAELAPEQAWDSIAFTVSRAEVPVWVIESCRPARIGLIASEQSKAAAQAIAELARSRGIEVFHAADLVNPDDPAEALAHVRHLLARLRAAGARELAVDITGGKTPMSLGAFMAAEEAGASSLYVSCPFDTALKQPDVRRASLRCISKPG